MLSKRCIVLLLTIPFVIAFTPAMADTHESGTLTIGRSADSVSLDPVFTSDSESGRVMAYIFEGLVRFAEDFTKVLPELAESWETSDDGKEWIFHLRNDVVFHDGVKFNASAAAFSFLRQIDPNHPYFCNNTVYAKFTLKYVKTVEVVDEYSLKFVLERPYAPFIYNLAMGHSAPIVSPEAVKKAGGDIKNHPVGTGPFRFVEWSPDDRIVIEVNPNYWGASPKLKRIVFRTIPDISVRLHAFQNGDIDVLFGIDPADAMKIKQLPDSDIVLRPPMNVAYLAMNTEKPPFDNINVRKAVNYAINKQNLIKLFYQGYAIPAKTPVPPSLWAYNGEIQDYPYNPDMARKILNDAGYPSGFKTSIWTMRNARPYMPMPIPLARAIQANLSVVGIEAEVMDFEWQDYLSRVSIGEHDMCLLGWIGDNGDPDNFLYVLFDKDNAVKPKARNRAFLKDPELHEILTAAQQIMDPNERTRLYLKAQKMIHELAPWVPLAHTQEITAVKNYVKGFGVHPTYGVHFGQSWIEKNSNKDK